MIEHFSYEAEQAEAEYFTTQPQSELDQARKDIAELVEALEALSDQFRSHFNNYEGLSQPDELALDIAESVITKHKGVSQ